MAKRITEKQKKEITEFFESGESIDFISRKYNCTKLTIIRNLKKNLGELEFKELAKKSKIPKLKTKNIKNQTLDKEKINFQNKDSKNTKVLNENITTPNFDLNDSFFEFCSRN